SPTGTSGSPVPATPSARSPTGTSAGCTADDARDRSAELVALASTTSNKVPVIPLRRRHRETPNAGVQCEGRRTEVIEQAPRAGCARVDSESQFQIRSQGRSSDPDRSLLDFVATTARYGTSSSGAIEN